jgi:hypothetical protein
MGDLGQVGLIIAVIGLFLWAINSTSKAWDERKRRERLERELEKTSWDLAEHKALHSGQDEKSKVPS